LKHPHGIHCLHVLGWETGLWCRACFDHWEEHCGNHRCDKYEKTADQYLAQCVVLDMEDGTLAISPAKRPAAEQHDQVDDMPEDDDPPTDGRRLLGWARSQPEDAKNWLVGLGKRLRYPNRILDWSPKQVQTAYQTYREAHRG
jgi:hypothetical protein